MSHGELQERYVAQARELLPAPIKRWVPEDRLQDALASSVAEALERVRDTEHAAAFRAAAPVPGTTPEDYLFRVLAIERDRSFLAGSRYRPEPPFWFVVVYARDFPIERGQTVARMSDAVRRAFAAFSPRYMCVDVAAGHREDRAVSGPSVISDSVTVAGLLSELQRLGPPPNMERVHLELAASTSFYGRYLAEYEAFQREAPHLAASVLPTPLDTLEGCLARRLLYEAYIDGEWAGVIAGREQTDDGMQGCRVVEELLSSRFRGRGFGPALQRRFIDTLPAGDREVLHGAIDPANAASLATAKRVGRIEVAHTRFVSL